MKSIGAYEAAVRLNVLQCQVMAERARPYYLSGMPRDWARTLEDWQRELRILEMGLRESIKPKESE